jgi:hypothetical protein
MLIYQMQVRLVNVLQYEPKRPSGQRPLEDLAGSNHDQCLVPRLASMEVWRRMIAEEHLDHDPVELADSRHQPILPNDRTKLGAPYPASWSR